LEGGHVAKTVCVEVEVPDSVPDETLDAVRRRAKETIVMMLQQQGELSIREAAMELGLSYERYLDRLAEVGLPATNNESDPASLDQIRRALKLK
jgi:hypothetical protein